MSKTASIPMQHVGPMRIQSADFSGEVSVPLATYESPLWPSVKRGAKISRLNSEGIKVSVVQEMMARSFIVEALDAQHATKLKYELEGRKSKFAEVISAQSRFAKFHDLNIQIVANLLYLRISINSGDAAGHNMVTKSAEAVLTWLLEEYTDLKYVSISGNYCTDKKVSAVNGVLGRGKYVVAEIIVPREICSKDLRSTPEQIVDLNIKKNLIGSTIAGSLRSANAHFANMLLAFYLATGQDAANIVEGSQGITHAQVNENGDLYFSVTIPNMILGAIGNGKTHDFVLDNLAKLGCRSEYAPGVNARILAVICGATVLCGELSLLAAQTNIGELMRTHILMERRH